MTHHDYVKFPELTNRQIEEFGFESPHKQITEDFEATVLKVVDGDTIRVNTKFRDFDFPIRLLDIDAPEMNEGGEEARDWLKGRILGKRVDIIMGQPRVDKYGRLLGKVFSDGLDVAEEERRMGLATSFENRREDEIPDFNKELDKVAL